MSSVAITHAEALTSTGFEVDLAGLCYSGQSIITTASLRTWQLRSRKGGGQRFLFSLPAAFWLYRHAGGYDVIHIHLCRDFVTCWAAIVARCRNVPYIVQPHGMIGRPKSFSLKMFDWLFVRRILRGAARSLVFTADEALSLSEVAASSLSTRTVFNAGEGAPVHRLDRREDTAVFRVQYVGRVHERKCVLELVSAVKQLRASYPNIVLQVTGPSDGISLARVQELGHPSWLRVEGNVHSHELERRYADAAVIVLASRNEPFPMAVVDAMHRSVPVIMSDEVSFSKAARDAGAALVVPPGNVNRLANAIESLYLNPAAAQGISTAAYDFARSTLSTERLTDVLSSEYGRAARQREATGEPGSGA